MKKFYFISFLISFLFISPAFASSILYQFFNTGDTSYFGFNYGTTWRGETFVTSDSYNLTNVRVKVFTSGITDVTLHIRATTGLGLPIGSDLGNKTLNTASWSTDINGSWVDFIFDTPIKLEAVTKYAILLSAVDEVAYWRVNEINDYSGVGITSVNNGISWFEIGGGQYDLLFENYGYSLTALIIPNPIIPNLTIGSTSNLFATASSLVTGLWLLIAITIGVPLGFWIIYKIMDLFPVK